MAVLLPNLRLPVVDVQGQTHRMNFFLIKKNIEIFITVISVNICLISIIYNLIFNLIKLI